MRGAKRTPSDGAQVTPATAADTGAAPTATGAGPAVLDRRLGHVEGFDGLRGVAVIIVVVSHLNVILPVPEVLVVPGGTVSLDSFFVLSGFLITYLLLREHSKSGRVDRWAFYRRRALRLLPALLAVVVAHAIYAQVVGLPSDLERSSLLSITFYYSNWQLAFSPANIIGGGTFAEGLQHLWSLSFEEQFYLVWPFVVILFLGARQRLRTVVVVLLGLIVVVAVHRALEYHGGMRWYPIFIRTDSRADAILVGALLAHLWIRRREPTRYLRQATWIAAIFLLVCLPLAQLEEPFLYYGGLVAIDVACAVLILAIIDGRWAGRHVFGLKIFVVLGMVSYGFYLWHLPVYFAVRRYAGQYSDPVRVGLALGITLALTAASWFCLERPTLNWKNRLERKRPNSVSAPTPTSIGTVEAEPEPTAPG